MRLGTEPEQGGLRDRHSEGMLPAARSAVPFPMALAMRLPTVNAAHPSCYNELLCWTLNKCRLTRVIKQAEGIRSSPCSRHPIWLPSGPITFQVSMLDTVIKVLGRYPGKQPCSALASYKRKAEKLLIRAQTFHHTVAQSFNLDSVLGLAQLRCNALSKHGYFNMIPRRRSTSKQ